jgi:hypothetical protein
LNNDIIKWLLEEDNPSVRYIALRELLGRKENSFEIIKVKSQILYSTEITKIFDKQDSKGYWLDKDSPYLPKYKASYWTIMLLGQLGLGRNDARVAKACEFIFEFQHEEGGFVSQTKQNLVKEYNWRIRKNKKLPDFNIWVKEAIRQQQLSCLTGNICAALIRLGYQDDIRVKKALDWLVKIQFQDGGWLCPYWTAHVKDKHGCFYGTICPLESFSEEPVENRSQETQTAIEKGAEFLLTHRLYRADHHNNKIINKGWLLFSFPWFYNYNILRGLDVLTKLGYSQDKRLDDAVKVLLGKQQKDGKWILENSPNGRIQTNIESKGKPSKWVTLIALRILKRLGKLSF